MNFKKLYLLAATLVAATAYAADVCNPFATAKTDTQTTKALKLITPKNFTACSEAQQKDMITWMKQRITKKHYQTSYYLQGARILYLVLVEKKNVNDQSVLQLLSIFSKKQAAFTQIFENLIKALHQRVSSETLTNIQQALLDIGDKGLDQRPSLVPRMNILIMAHRRKNMGSLKAEEKYALRLYNAIMNHTAKTTDPTLLAYMQPVVNKLEKSKSQLAQLQAILAESFTDLVPAITTFAHDNTDFVEKHSTEITQIAVETLPTSLGIKAQGNPATDEQVETVLAQLQTTLHINLEALTRRILQKRHQGRDAILQQVRSILVGLASKDTLPADIPAIVFLSPEETYDQFHEVIAQALASNHHQRELLAQLQAYFSFSADQMQRLQHEIKAEEKSGDDASAEKAAQEAIMHSIVQEIGESLTETDSTNNINTMPNTLYQSKIKRIFIDKATQLVQTKGLDEAYHMQLAHALYQLAVRSLRDIDQKDERINIITQTFNKQYQPYGYRGKPYFSPDEVSA